MTFNQDQGDGSHILSAREAYRVMFRFLEGYWERTQSDDLAGLLGGFAINPYDGLPMDRAAWSDWCDALDQIRAERKTGENTT